MYEFSSDSWRVLDVDTSGWTVTSRGLSLKDNAYWIGVDKETGVFMLSFDFTTERFKRLPLPYASHNGEDTAVLSVVEDERLSVVHQNITSDSLVMKIWVTNKFVDTNDMSWSSFLVVDLDKFMLPSVTNVMSFLFKVAVCCDRSTEYGGPRDMERMIIYVVGEDIYKQVYKEITKGRLLDWPLLVSYSPSLVPIQAKVWSGREAIFIRSVNKIDVKFKPKGQNISKSCSVASKED